MCPNKQANVKTTILSMKFLFLPNDFINCQQFPNTETNKLNTKALL